VLFLHLGALRDPLIARSPCAACSSPCNKAIYSLGPCTLDTHVVQFKIATTADIEEYSRRGAVGIITGRFIDRDGQAVLGYLDEKIIGVDHDLLRSMEGLLVVSGNFKHDAVLAALRGGFVDHLVVCAPLAEMLVASCKK